MYEVQFHLSKMHQKQNIYNLCICKLVMYGVLYIDNSGYVLPPERSFTFFLAASQFKFLYNFGQGDLKAMRYNFFGIIVSNCSLSSLKARREPKMVFSLENLELLIAFYMATGTNFRQTATSQPHCHCCSLFLKIQAKPWSYIDDSLLYSQARLYLLGTAMRLRHRECIRCVQIH